MPVISTVGHETDTTLRDFAADRRAPTPSARPSGWRMSRGGCRGATRCSPASASGSTGWPRGCRALARRLAEARTALAGVWRGAESLAPQRVLERGYARVEVDGRTITAAAARAAGALRVVFADGAIDVAVPPPGGRGRAKPPAPPGTQPRLL